MGQQEHETSELHIYVLGDVLLGNWCLYVMVVC